MTRDIRLWITVESIPTTMNLSSVGGTVSPMMPSMTLQRHSARGMECLGERKRHGLCVPEQERMRSGLLKGYISKGVLCLSDMNARQITVSKLVLSVIRNFSYQDGMSTIIIGDIVSKRTTEIQNCFVLILV